MSCSIHLLFFIFFAIPLFLRAQPYDYPTANLSSLWTNNNNSLQHSVSYPDGTAARAILLRSNPNFDGPSFACGFYCNAACDAFILAVFIVYTNSGGLITMPTLASPQVVWSANRDLPVEENATLSFTNEGDLILRYANGSAVWSTNTSGMSVVGMNITESGNLVLFDRNNVSVWQSFDHPTDSLVPGQSLKEGQRLAANISATNWTPGQLYLTVLSGGLYAYADSSPPQLYYSKGFGANNSTNGSSYVTFMNGTLAGFPQPGQQVNLISLPSASSVQYMRLESDGHLRIYEWSSGWQVVDDVFNLDACAYPTVCGEYGICSNGQCSCPRGANGSSNYFNPINDRQSNLGCYPVTALSCQSMQDHQFLSLKNVSYFNILDYDAAAFQRIDEGSCMQACLKNCSCKAALFRYGGNASDGDCFLPSQVFSLQNIQPTVTHYNASAYLKVRSTFDSTSALAPSSSVPSGKKNTSLGVTLGSIAGALSAGLIAVGIIFVLVRRKRATEEEVDDFDQVPGMPTRFSFEELKVATTNFSKMLGKGGFGSVYEGKIGNDRVAVKRLDGVGQGKKEFLAEVVTIGNIHHVNLVRLIGFCAEKSHRLLVYECLSNGSLDKWIFCRNQDEVSLDWHSRFKIITDIAKGLAYLHEECRQRIAHLDIKPQNILLDDKFNAKVSDFGLSKLIDRDKSHVMTRMRGTPGYLAPEWLTSVITEKVDVYSFGVVVMEIVCGRKNLDYSQPEERMHLLSLLQDKIRDNMILDLVDSRNIDLNLHEAEVTQMIRMAIWCLQSESNRRPSMSTVVKVLEGAVGVEEADLDYNFFTKAPVKASHTHQWIDSPPQSASLLSGAR